MVLVMGNGGLGMKGLVTIGWESLGWVMEDMICEH